MEINTQTSANIANAVDANAVAPSAPATNYTLYMVIILVAIVVIVAIYVGIANRKKRIAQNMLLIQDNLENGRGGVGNTSVGNAIGDAPADTNYQFAQDDAQKICNAGGYYGSWSQSFFSFLGGANVEKIKAVFMGKTKGQIAAIKEAFARTNCNQSLDTFLQTQLDAGERQQIYQLIKQAQ